MNNDYYDLTILFDAATPNFIVGKKEMNSFEKSFENKKELIKFEDAEKNVEVNIRYEKIGGYLKSKKKTLPANLANKKE